MTTITVNTIEYSLVFDTSSNAAAAGEIFSFSRNGDRKLVNLKTEIKYIDGSRVNNAVLTLLNKDSNLFSLSIKVDKSNAFNLDSLNFNNKKLYSSITETYKDQNQNQNFNLSHMLFIGNVDDNDVQKEFKINKTILITNDNIGQEKQYNENDIEDEEEYLNLYYIDYFSFMYEDFKEMYKNYKEKNISNIVGTSTPAPLAPASTPAPLAPAPKPAEEAPKPAEEAPKQAEEAPKPAEEAPKPAEEAARKEEEEEEEEAKEAPKPAEEASRTGGKKKVKKTKTKKAKKV